MKWGPMLMENDGSANQIAAITIEKDRLDFFLFAYFGTVNNPYLASSRRAYLDFCRTLRFNGGSGQEYREYIDGLLERRILNLVGKHISTQEEYDVWHHNLCDDLVSYYRTAGVDFYIGHAQKWINMTMKYLYMHGVDVTEVFPYLHVPLDQYVFAAVKNSLAIPCPCASWSRIEDYDIYLDYQKMIREKVDGAPLRWEFCHWMDEAMCKS